MSVADTSFQESQYEGKDMFRNALYEYEFSDWFSHCEKQKDKHKITEKVNFKLSLLNVESTWVIERIDGNEKTGVYSVKRRLNFLPFKETINNWSIRIDVSDLIAAGFDDEKKRKKRNGPEKEFRNLTADNENPFVEFEYNIEETESLVLFTNCKCDYWCEMHFSVISCKGLESYLGLSIDFTSSFDGSNVILELDNGKRLYFVMEVLAVQSPIFYKKWLERAKLTVEDSHYLIKMENTDVRGLILMLKMMAYKKNCLHINFAETVALVAKAWKFEMVLVACEDFFISKLGENFLKFNYLAQQYDMAQLQHVIAEKEEEKFERLRELEKLFAEQNGEEPKQPITISPEERYLEHVTSEKFDLPEIRTIRSTRHKIPINFAIKNHKSTMGSYKVVLEWKIRWKLGRTGHVYLTIGPVLTNVLKEPHFNALNWSVHAVFTVFFNGKENKITGFFTPSCKRMSYIVDTNVQDIENTLFDFTITTNVKSVRGLRYFVKDEKLRTFEDKTPSSDVVLKCQDRKLFANLNILSMCSLFFKGMKDHSSMQTLDEEEQLPVVIMDDIESVVFRHVLNYAYSISRNEVNVQDLESIIPVADRFLFVGLLHHCELQLITANNYPLGLRTLDFAIKHRLYALKDSYLKHFKSIGEIQRLKEDPSYQEMSDMAKVLLYETVMSLPLVD